MHKPNLLLTEGKSDALVANHLADWHGLPDYYDFGAYEGCEQLLEALPVRLKESGRQRVAVVVDANGDPAARWQALHDRVAPLGYAPPPNSEAGGVVLAAPAGLPRLGLWLMPDNGSPGMLEDLLLSLIRPGDTLLPHARTAVAGVPVVVGRFKDAHATKAIAFTWLAWRDAPGSSFGPAIKSGAFDANAPAATALIAWLRRVFD
jgi:hypothetical protein